MPGMGQGRGAGNSPIIGAFHNALLWQGGLIFLMVVVLLVGWNVLRAQQLRRALLRGEPYPGPRPVLPTEPLARRVLRLGLAAFWIIDGLLQMQPQMPLGLPSAVLRPAADTSPGWLRDLVDFGVTTWTRHPVEAAAATVWIQLGVGILLLVAPLGRWSRVAGLVGVGWGLVVWVFGEALGGLFAPGLTFLFGAPGGVVFYVVAGGLLALPDRSWATRRLGRAITGSIGVFLLVMAVLQAWPGRGFWQGSVAGRPGTLAGMVRAMAATPQPHPLASMVSAFGSFDRAHGFTVNLFAVVVLAAIGTAFLWGGRLLYPALIALIVVGLADWILIEDFGVWGGTGTDPNSMPPMLLLAVGGYLAMVRVPSAEAPLSAPTGVTAGVDVPPPGVPASASEGAPAGVMASEEEAVTEEVAGRSRAWWERIDPGYAGRMAAALGAVVIVLMGTVPMVVAACS
jgi:hypothetical protein